MMTCRFAQASDIDRISEIENNSMSCPWKKADFQEALESKHTIFSVAEENQNVVGFSILYLSAPEAELPDIVIDEKYRGVGVGETLLRFSIEAACAKGVDTVFLEVRKSNDVAKGLYRKLGFEELGVRKNFYREPVEDAICMKLVSLKG